MKIPIHYVKTPPSQFIEESLSNGIYILESTRNFFITHCLIIRNNHLKNVLLE